MKRFANYKPTFIKEADFESFAKGKTIESYPNKWIKKVDGESVQIIPEREKIVFTEMSEEDKLWHGIRFDGVVYEASTSVLGFFPTELVCGVLVRPGRLSCFSSESPLAKETGWLDTNGTFGSRNDAFSETGVKNAAKRLRDAGFEVELIIDEEQ